MLIMISCVNLWLFSNCIWLVGYKKNIFDSLYHSVIDWLSLISYHFICGPKKENMMFVGWHDGIFLYSSLLGQCQLAEVNCLIYVVCWLVRMLARRLEPFSHLCMLFVSDLLISYWTNVFKLCSIDTWDSRCVFDMCRCPTQTLVITYHHYYFIKFLLVFMCQYSVSMFVPLLFLYASFLLFTLAIFLFW